MATAEEREALLGVGCPWCGAAVGEPCSVPVLAARAAEGGPRRPRMLPGPSTLDGGCHDARWRAALHQEAPVRVEVLDGRRTAAAPRALVAAGERPW